MHKRIAAACNSRSPWNQVVNWTTYRSPLKLEADYHIWLSVHPGLIQSIRYDESMAMIPEGSTCKKALRFIIVEYLLLSRDPDGRSINKLEQTISR